jgi:hypothetical protein
MKSLIVALAGLATLWSATTANAQQAINPVNPTGYSYGESYYATPQFGYGYGHVPYYGYRFGYPGTAFGDFQRGLAARIAAQGQYNFLTAEAAISLEEARGIAIENDSRAIQAYWQRRDEWTVRNEATRMTAITPQRAQRLVDMQTADRPTVDQLNPVTAEIEWPLVLQTRELARQRVEIEALFARRAAGQLNPGQTIHHQVKAQTELMRDWLADRARELPFNEYAEAKRLLESLTEEARHPDQRAELAAR